MRFSFRESPFDAEIRYEKVTGYGFVVVLTLDLVRFMMGFQF